MIDVILHEGFYIVTKVHNDPNFYMCLCDKDTFTKFLNDKEYGLGSC